MNRLVLDDQGVSRQGAVARIATAVGAVAVGAFALGALAIGRLVAIPKALRLAGLQQQDIDWIELNEAFAAQSLAVVRTLDLDPAKVNPLGGAIALGHPLGATGAIRTATVVHGLQRTRGRYGMVTMCVGTGMGAAGIFEAIVELKSK